MRRGWGWLALLGLTLGLLGCCGGPAPDEVRTATTNNLSDFVALEAELLPLVPEAATFTYTNIHGDDVTKNARAVWKQRIRGLLFRGAGLKSWADGEPYDAAAAFAKLFPELAAEGGDTP